MRISTLTTLAASTEPQPIGWFADHIILPILAGIYVAYALSMIYVQCRDARENGWSGKSDIILRHLACWVLWGVLYIVSYLFMRGWVSGFDHDGVHLGHLVLYFWWWILSPIAFAVGPAMMTFNKGHAGQKRANFWRRFWQLAFVCSGWWLGIFINFIEIFY